MTKLGKEPKLSTQIKIRLLEHSAEGVFRTLSQRQKNIVALWALRTLKQHQERAEELRIERDATREREKAAWERECKAREEKAAQKQMTKEQEYQILFDHPERVYSTNRDLYYMTRRPERESFRRWCGDRFSDWVERARRTVEHERLDFFDSDWYDAGPEAYFRHKSAKRVAEVIDVVREYTRLEVTAELLGTKFSLGDGRKVTWGQATIADHEQRIGMLGKNAVANVEAAARHKCAIEMITSAGVERLGDLC